MRREAGLTLIEISISFALLAIASMGVAASMMTGIAGNRQYELDTIVLNRGQHYLETLYNLQIGSDSDPAATGADLDLVFGGDPELGTNPPSLISICKAINSMPAFLYEFTPQGFGTSGTYLVRVTNNVISSLSYPTSVDPDQDGIPDDGDATMVQGNLLPQFIAGCFEADNVDEGRELLAFEVYFRPANPPAANPKLLLRAFRAQDY